MLYDLKLNVTHRDGYDVFDNDNFLFYLNCLYIDLNAQSYPLDRTMLSIPCVIISVVVLGLGPWP